MAKITSATIGEVQDRIDALAVVKDYVQLEKKGGRYWGRCPFHNEKTPSFTVDPDKKTYYCFGCHEGGGIVNFIMAMDKLSFPQAIENLAKRFGVPIIRENSEFASEESEAEKELDTLTELYKHLAGTFHYFLMETEAGKPAKDYILSRKISEDMIKRFNLGYSPPNRSWLFNFLTKKGYSPDFLAKSGLFLKTDGRAAFFANRLMFPISDKNGKLQAFGGRILSGEGAKYLNSAESLVYKKRETLFAIDLAMPEIRKTKEVIIAEGYMDVIALHQAGITNAVAPLGTAFTEEQAKLLGRWVNKINILFDSDEAGLNAAVKAILCCRKNNIQCGVISGEKQSGVNTLKDPADILKESGEEALKDFVKFVILDFEFLLARSMRAFDTSDSRGKAMAVASLFPFLELVDSDVERVSHVGKIAGAFSADPQSVLSDYKIWKKGKNVWQKDKVSDQDKIIRMTEELYLLTAVSVHFSDRMDLWLVVRKTLQIENFSDPNAKELYIVLEECYRTESTGKSELLDKIKNEALKNFIAEKLNTDEFSYNPDLIVADGIRRLKEKDIAVRRTALVSQIRVAQDSGAELENLIQEKIYLDTAMLELKGAAK
ncbi:MAG: DNA primase [Spirochaetaceae bacterium]|jgi:DNA primase|nr:DNA primase [Spirochaetaceae bacterium]